MAASPGPLALLPPDALASDWDAPLPPLPPTEIPAPDPALPPSAPVPLAALPPVPDEAPPPGVLLLPALQPYTASTAANGPITQPKVSVFTSAVSHCPVTQARDAAGHQCR